MLRPFALYQPSTVAEAADVLSREGSDAALYAGGTELLLVLKTGFLRLRALVDVKRIPGLGEIDADGGAVRIGATATHRAVERSAAVQAHCPMVARVARHVATVEMGQGARTVMAQIAAEVLAIPLERITVVPPDTSITPYDQTTSSSRSTTMVGRAVHDAAADVVAQLLRIAAARLGVPPGTLAVADGAVLGEEQRIGYSELLDHHFGMRGGELIGRGVVAPGRTATALGGSTPFWEVAMGAAEISLDEETGAISVEAYASVSGVGRCINPRQCEAQDEGAVVQGLGHTLLEEMVYGGRVAGEPGREQRTGPADRRAPP